jgi:uncharacterized SAM-binding protein YcdF (DUF218 family)
LVPISRLLGFLFLVSNLIAFVAVAAALALIVGLPRLSKRLVWVTVLMLVLFGFGPLGSILMRPLEDRFPRPPDNMTEPDGIIVLGGIVSPVASATRNAIALTQDGERLIDAAALAIRYPQATLVFSGGPLSVVPTISEAAAAKRLFTNLGISEARIVIEGQSATTDQNATFTRDLVKPSPGQRWMLVTSASHMPRAVGAFRRAGFPVIPYPTGYTTSGLVQDFWEIRLEVSTSLVRADVAVREWIGLLYYWLTGRTETLFPGPDPQSAA